MVTDWITHTPGRLRTRGLLGMDAPVHHITTDVWWGLVCVGYALLLLLILMVMPARNRSKRRLVDEAAQKSGSWTKAAQGMDCIPAVRSPLAPKGRRKNHAAEIRIFVRHHSFCTPAFVDSNLRRCAECACCCGPQLTSTCARAFGDHASRHFQS